MFEPRLTACPTGRVRPSQATLARADLPKTAFWRAKKLAISELSPYDSFISEFNQ